MVCNTESTTDCLNKIFSPQFQKLEAQDPGAGGFGFSRGLSSCLAENTALLLHPHMGPPPVQAFLVSLIKRTPVLLN